MNPDSARPETVDVWRGEILRLVRHVLHGRVVAIWRATADSVEPIFTGTSRPLPVGAARELNEALRRWKVPTPAGSQWVACRLDMGRWCIAPIRHDIRAPAPGGLEGRKRERMALELAGHCLGLLDRQFGELRADAEGA
jgi:hypothetical protein